MAKSGGWNYWVIGVLAVLLVFTLFVPPGALRMSPAVCDEGYIDLNEDGVCEPENTEVSTIQCNPPGTDFLCKQFSYYQYLDTVRRLTLRGWVWEDIFERTPTLVNNCLPVGSFTCTPPKVQNSVSFDPSSDIPERARSNGGTCFYCEDGSDGSATDSGSDSGSTPAVEE